MMTEAEAAKRWCPFSRPVMPRVEDCGYQTGNRNYVDPQGGSQIMSQTICLASECMAWRWAEDPDSSDPAYRRTPVKGSPGHFDNEPLGYCGLAGRP